MAMKWMSFTQAGRPGFGLAVDQSVLEAPAEVAQRWPSLWQVVSHGQATEVAQAILKNPRVWPLAELTVALPMPDAPRIFCIGRNYKGHVAEVGSALPKHPSLFIRGVESLVPHGQPLERPKASADFDFEGELAVVMGEGGRHIARQQALSKVFGYTIFNDGSVRDVQFQHSLTAGKNFYRSGAMGPWIVSAADIPDPTQLWLSTTLNGQRVQHSQTDDLIFDIPAIIEYISGFTPLQAGDIIATGTPDGVGMARKPPLWLKPGDLIDVQISQIGCLSNGVRDGYCAGA
jgi:2-keto-4-pentenoate hydratase/2-oxohepta-3-ene-1,7-dioic acid hydratase in catechol pathway